MLIACWSPKGGCGTTVVSAALGLVLAASDGPTLLADLDGDIPAVLGMPEPTGPGLSHWLHAGPDVPEDALARLEVDVRPGLRLLPSGRPGGVGDDDPGRAQALAASLATDPRPVVADCGRAASGAALAVAAGASLSLLVLRPCYLGLRRAVTAPLRASGLVLVNEEGRSLSGRDIEEALGIPLRAHVPYDAAIARAVDAGLLAARIPRRLERSLRRAA